MPNLQIGSPTLHQVLDDIAADGSPDEVRLVAVPSGGAPAPARSWLRRVAADWMRRNPDSLDLRVDRTVTPLTGCSAAR